MENPFTDVKEVIQEQKVSAENIDLPGSDLQRCNIENNHNKVINQGYNVITVNDKTIKRLQDIGRIRGKLEEIMDSKVFETENKDIQHLKDKLLDCWAIAAGKEE